VLRGKERLVTRRHGALLRSGTAMLPDESTLCATCWMHGVFAAQLTIGNTSFHKLFSVSRDPYNIMRASGLRVLIDTGSGWRLLTIPSAFEMGLSDCRWIYAFADRVITVRAIASGDDPAMQWRISIDGAPCRLLVFGHLVLGERDLEHRGNVLADSATAGSRSTRSRVALGTALCRCGVSRLRARRTGRAMGGDELLSPIGLGRVLMSPSERCLRGSFASRSWDR
jgi:hypothetical protein